MSTKLGSGYLELSIQYAEAMKQITSDLEKVGKDFSKSVEGSAASARQSTKGMSDDIDKARKSTREMSKDMDEVAKKGRQSTKGMSDDIDKARKSTRDMARDMGEVGKKGREAGKIARLAQDDAAKSSQDSWREAILGGVRDGLDDALKNHEDAAKESGETWKGAILGGIRDGIDGALKDGNASRIEQLLSPQFKRAANILKGALDDAVKGTGLEGTLDGIFNFADKAKTGITNLGTALEGVKKGDAVQSLNGVAGALRTIGEADAASAVNRFTAQLVPASEQIQALNGMLDGFIGRTLNARQQLGATLALGAWNDAYSAKDGGDFAWDVGQGAIGGAVIGGALGGPIGAFGGAVIGAGGSIASLYTHDDKVNEKTRQMQERLRKDMEAARAKAPGVAAGDLILNPTFQSQSDLDWYPNNGGRWSNPNLPGLLIPQQRAVAPSAFTSPMPPQGSGGVDMSRGGPLPYAPTSSHDANKAAVYRAYLAAGFAPQDFSKLDYIIQHESNYDVNATNPATGDWGIPQFNPAAGNIARYIPDRSTDPFVQGSAMMRYIKDRYGTMDAAYQFKQKHGWYDDGGVLPPGITIAHNESGKPELVLTGEQADQYQSVMGDLTGSAPIDPNGPTPDKNGNNGLTDLMGLDKNGSNPLRTQGYIPAGAGGGGEAGTSFAAGLINVGAEAINGLIDQAAQAASTAASAAITAGSFGAGGQAGSAAASFAINMGAQAAKRGVQYGAQMLGIGVDSVIEQLTPFGAPRWLQTDPMQFMPQIPNLAQAVTTGEKAKQAQQQPNTGVVDGPGQQPGGPVQPNQLPGQQVIGSPAQPADNRTPLEIKAPSLPVGPGAANNPQAGAPSVPQTPPVINAGPAPKQEPAPTPKPAPPSQPLTPQQQGLDNYLNSLRVYDDGGVIPPGGIAVNMMKRPEPLAAFTPPQWETLSRIANNSRAMTPDPEAIGGNDYGVHYHGPITVKDVDELTAKTQAAQKLAMMRYAGRHQS